ncbi:MAG: hypothetical protein JW982_09335 [Spirochaetes bacterium]|nr:hypothetical protein [Spirochaetota bacterium]
MRKNNVRFTSANMDERFFVEIKNFSSRFNVLPETVFKDILLIVTEAAGCGRIIGVLTEYQDHVPEKWLTFYYSLDANEIEQYSSARQKYKISISKLAFIGFVLFWKALLFRYSERLKIATIDIIYNSYGEYNKKVQIYASKFRIRMKIKQKE